MSWFESLILGLVQGLTEFLPVSSSAHLRLTAAFSGWKDPGAAFTAITQIGTEAPVQTPTSRARAKPLWRGCPLRTLR